MLAHLEYDSACELGDTPLLEEAVEIAPLTLDPLIEIGMVRRNPQEEADRLALGVARLLKGD